MKQWTTTQDFITYGGKGLPVGTIVETVGFYEEGDGGGAKWQLTAATGTPSQTPAQLGDALLNDASGRQWRLIDEIIGSSLESLGLVGDGIANDSPVLAAMITYKAANGGGDIYVGAKTIGITQLFNIPVSNIRFFGVGHNCNLFALANKGTIIKWIGAATTGYMMSIRTPDNISAEKTNAVMLEGICLDGNGLASRGLNLRTVDNCAIRNIGMQNLTEWGIYTDTNINPPSTSALDNQHNFFDSVVINMTGMPSAGGMKLTANPLSPPSNTSMNEIHNLSIRIENGNALHFGNADSNTVQHFRVFRMIANTGNAVVYDQQLMDPSPNTNNMYARTNVIYHMHSAQAGVIAHDSPSAFKPAFDNAIYGWNLDGNAPNVTITRNNENSLKIFSARNSELPSVNGISLAATTFANGNNLAVNAINSRSALGLPAKPASYLYKDSPNALHQVIDDGNGHVFSIEVNEGTGNFVINRLTGDGLIQLNNQLQLQSQTTSTSASSGAATTLPANPQGYLSVTINGVSRKMPFYT